MVVTVASEPFELELLGGAAEHHYRRARPGLDDLPWETLDTSHYPPALLEGARRSWTEVAVNEYRAVIAFTHVVRSLAAVRAPIDLLGMAAEFVLDEVTHVELASRMCMALGGSAPVVVDTSQMYAVPGNLSPREEANELVLRVSCVAEVYAGKTSIEAMRACTHPLPKAVHTRILKDESRHLRLGELYFDWMSEMLDDAERARLGSVLTKAILGHEHYLKRRISRVRDGVTEEGYKVSDIHELGWLESERFVPLAKKVMRDDVLDPLARRGIVPESGMLDALLAG